MTPPALLLESAPRAGGRPASFWRFAEAPAPGAGRTAVLALGGLGLDGRAFSRMGPLAKERDLVLVNLPNEIPRGSGMEHLAREAWAAFDAAGHAGRPAILMGSSLGGMVATAAALAAPERAAALVLLGAPVAWSDVPLRLRAAARLHRFVPRRPYPAVFAAVMLPPFKDLPPEIRQELRIQMLHRTKGFIGGCLGAMRGFDAKPRLGSIRAPTLVIHGERDGVIPIRAGAAVAAAVPGARLLRVPSCGHLPQVSHPEVVVETVGGFLAERGL